MRLLGPDGTPLERRYACSADDRALSDDEIERGYEIEEGKFVLVTDEELAKLAPRRSRDIELTRFVDRDEIDPVYFVRPYFVLPDAEQTKAYRLLAEAMESSHRAALATFVMRGKSHAIAIFADRGLLRAATLRFGDELRSPSEIGAPAKTKTDATQVAKWKRAIQKLTAKELDERDLVDEDAGALLTLAEKKLAKGKDVVNVPEAAVEESPEPDASETEEQSSGGEVIDLFALIQKRLRESPSKRRAATKPAEKRSQTPKRAAPRKRSRATPK